MADLKQTRILVTRPAHQAENLCALIHAHNGIPIRLPTLEIIPIILSVDEIEQHLTSAIFVIFTSVNAVRCYCSQLDDAKMRDLKNKSCLAIGKATHDKHILLEVEGEKREIAARGYEHFKH